MIQVVELRHETQREREVRVDAKLVCGDWTRMQLRAVPGRATSPVPGHKDAYPSMNIAPGRAQAKSGLPWRRR